MMPPHQAPPGYAPAPPPRQGKPWWFWLLIGCAGISMLGAVGVGMASWYAYNYVQKTVSEVGPVDEASVTKALGEIPLYPGSTLEVDGTKAVLVTFRMAEKWRNEKPGSLVKGAAILNTQDPAEKIVEFYDRELTTRGYVRASTSEKGDSVRVYTKKDEFVTVSTTRKTASDPTQVSLARGGPMLVEMERQTRNRLSTGAGSTQPVTDTTPSPASPSSPGLTSPPPPSVAPSQPVENPSFGDKEPSPTPSASEDTSQ